MKLYKNKIRKIIEKRVEYISDSEKYREGKLKRTLKRE